MKKLIKGIATVVVVFGLAIVAPLFNVTANAAKPIYDLSEWQGTISTAQAKRLKSETSFLILRSQYGASYKDRVFQNNARTLAAAGVKYGVYSYSRYTSASSAANEASSLIKSAPKAIFYVNDAEENDVTSGSMNSATVAWANRARQLTTRPIVLYSYQSFMSNFSTAKKAYDAIWLASYTNATPSTSFHYDLWQFTDKYYSSALGKSVDASKIPSGGKPISFWIGGSTTSTTATQTAKTTAKVSTTVAKVVQSPNVISIPSTGNYISNGTRFEVKSKHLNEYTNITLKNRASSSLRKGDIVRGSIVKHGNTYRIKTDKGTYFSANKNFVEVLE